MTRTIIIWKGSHGPLIRRLVEQAWRAENVFLVLCPPTLNKFDWVAFLPEGELRFEGEWDQAPDVSNISREPTQFPVAPVLGLFTTGTTGGETKLVVYSRENVRASLNAILSSAFDMSGIDGVFCYPQPFHTFGLLLGYVLALEKRWTLFTGGGKYSTPHHHARVRVPTLKLLTLGTPTHFQDLMTYVRTHNVVLRPTYSCIVGGASVSRELWLRLQSELVIESPSIGYGVTEASPGVAHLPAGRKPVEDGEVGLALPGLRLELRPGEGYGFSGASVCMAIVHSNGVEFPERVFISDELEQRADGVLVYRGRSDLVINRGGEKLSLESIERHLRERLALETMAFSIPNTRLGQELGLLIKAPIGVPGLRERVADELLTKWSIRFDAGFFRVVPTLPMNASHKPDRRAAVEFFKGAP